ncbi:hypothetical protein RND71_042881 [Anisodus tanguticus]|uniref:Uncharacterized protein n=1 Tax=Anisodus tanguticus TaxID=243964 RepID=A0AAE1UV65_9SOLA|nr:hypothetical protein RND71_042881 [Anisodus tanguticus]
MYHIRRTTILLHSGSMWSTKLSRWFKQRCPDAYSYPQDDPTSTFTCQSWTTDYKVMFYPYGAAHNETTNFPLEMPTNDETVLIVLASTFTNNLQ